MTPLLTYSPRTLRALGAALVALCCCSCGDGTVKVYPVRGSVTFNGKPTPGATVVFHLTERAANKSERPPLPSGEVQEDGSFTLRTHPYGGGAPAGEYRVAVVWLDRARQGSDGTVPNKLPGRYANPETSGLKAVVKAGSTELPPFELKK